MRGRIVNISSVDAFKAHPEECPLRRHQGGGGQPHALLRARIRARPDSRQLRLRRPALPPKRQRAPVSCANSHPHTPLDRNAEPDEIAGWIAILLDDRNTYMTGETVIVSGGYIFA